MHESTEKEEEEVKREMEVHVCQQRLLSIHDEYDVRVHDVHACSILCLVLPRTHL